MANKGLKTVVICTFPPHKSVWWQEELRRHIVEGNNYYSPPYPKAIGRNSASNHIKPLKVRTSLLIWAKPQKPP